MAMKRIEIPFGGLSNSSGATRIAQDRCFSCQNVTADNEILEGIGRYSLLGARSSPNSADIGWGIGYGKFTGSELQKLAITGTPTSGYTVLSFGGHSTAHIPYNSTAATVQTDLLTAAGSALQSGDIVLTGGPWPDNPIYAQFGGRYANTDVALITAADAFGGGTAPTTAFSEVIKGGTNEEYLVVLQKSGDTTATLYSVAPGTGVYTQIATGLHASDWSFKQFANRVWMANDTDGLHYKILGQAQYDGRASGTAPAPPYNKPVCTPTVSAENPISAFSGTFAVTGDFAAVPAIASSGQNVTITLTANQLRPGTAYIDISLTPDQDWRRADYWRVYSTTTGTIGGVAPYAFLVLDGAASVEAQHRFVGQLYGTSAQYSEFQFADLDRAGRRAIDTVRIYFTLYIGAVGDTITLRFARGYVWMNDTDELNMTTGYTVGPIEYAASYFDVATQIESALGPIATSPSVPASTWGTHMNLAESGSHLLTNTDKVYFYRKEKATGFWRRLPNLDGTVGVTNDSSGAPVFFTDTNMEHELADFDTPPVTFFPGADSGVVAGPLTTWRGSLVVGASKQIWMSNQGEPAAFQPSPDSGTGVTSADAEDPTLGVTEYASADRSEDISSVHGLESLYAVTPQSVYAVVGDSPLNSLPPRPLPGSRGSVGTRAAAPYKNGVLVAAVDGLWYYEVSRGFTGDNVGAQSEQEVTLDARTSYVTTLYGGSGSGMVVIENLDQVWVVNGAKYMVLTRSKRWFEGTFTDSIKAAVSTRQRGLVFLDSKGRVLQNTATAATDAGTAINWSYVTGKLISPRARIVRLEVHYTGTPTVVMDPLDGSVNPASQSVTLPSNLKVEQIPINVLPGTQHQVTMSGVTGRDTITNLFIWVEDMGAGMAV